MTDRCEPPEELRGVDGWHWVDRHGLGDPELLAWRRNSANGDFEWWYDRGGARFISGESQTASYWHYEGAALTPAEVAALREERDAAVAEERRVREAWTADASELYEQRDTIATLRAENERMRDALEWSHAAFVAQRDQAPVRKRLMALTIKNQRLAVIDIAAKARAALGDTP